jgi:serine protease Do
MLHPQTETDPVEKPKRSKFIVGLFVGVLIAIGVMYFAGGLAGLSASDVTTSEDDADNSGLVASPDGVSSADTPSYPTSSPDESRRSAIVQAVERVSPAVVTISVTQLRRERVMPPMFNDPRWRHFFPDKGREIIRELNSMGSGFIVSSDGHILTNEHVIHGASRIVVSLPDGRSFEGKVFGKSDAQTDLAVVKIDGSDLPSAPLAEEADLMIGEWAIAIGNPFGYLIRDVKPTVTVGVISALNRDFDVTTMNNQVYRDMIQTDASINPGNSGGPLVNSNGEVIGVNSFIFSQSGGSQGVGFAIPIQRARQIMDDILRYGEVRHNFWTGIHIQDVTRWIAESLRLPTDRGAIITEIEPASPGSIAGLRRGDVITAVDGRPVKGAREVRQEFVGAVVGQQMQLSIIREGSEQTVPITLDEMPTDRRSGG